MLPWNRRSLSNPVAGLGPTALKGFRRGRPPACRPSGTFANSDSRHRPTPESPILRLRAAVAPEEVQTTELEGDSCDAAVCHCELGDGVECNVAQEDSVGAVVVLEVHVRDWVHGR